MTLVMMATKVVQTRLDLNLYGALQRADSQGLTLQGAAREAIRRWVTEETRFADSPLFNFDVMPGKGPATDSSDDDSVLYRGRKRRSSSALPGM
jgi:hypothetical protein